LAEEYIPPDDREKPKNQMSGSKPGCGGTTLIAASGCVVLLAALVFGLFMIAGGTLEGIGTSVRAVVDRIFPAPSATVDVSSSVVTNVRLLSDVVTLRTQLVKSRVAVNLRQGVVGACSFTALHIAEGDFEAGIDLSQINREDIVYNEETNSYLLSLPQPYLRSCHVEVEKYAGDPPVGCGADWPQITNLAEYVAMQEFLNDIAGGDMYDVARRNAEIVIGTFVENLLGTETEIRFSNQPIRAEDASCRAQPPTGWTQDDNRVWTRP
jgi:hypothetical protein